MQKNDLPGAFGESDELAAIFDRFRSSEKHEEWERNKELVARDAENFLALEPLLNKKELFDKNKVAEVTIVDLENDPDIASSPHFELITQHFNRKQDYREDKFGQVGETVAKLGGGVAYGVENINPFRVNKVQVGYSVVERFLNMDDGNYSRSVLDSEEREGLVEKLKIIKSEMAECKLSGRDVDVEKLRELYLIVNSINNRFLKDSV